MAKKTASFLSALIISIAFMHFSAPFTKAATTDVDYSVAYINDFEGDCTIKRSGKSIAEAIMTDYTPLYKGDTVMAGTGSRIEIVFDDSTIVKLDAGTKMVVRSLSSGKQKKTLLEVIKGKVIAIVKKLTTDESFAVKTKMAVAAVKGTEFIVESDDDERVGVFEGAVEVTATDMNGKVLNKVMVDKDKETIVTKSLRKADNPKVLSKNFTRRYKEIKDLKSKIEFVRELRRSGKIREYKLERRLKRIENMKMMKRNPAMMKSMTPEQKQLVDRIIQEEAFYKGEIAKIKEKQDNRKMKIKKMMKK